MLQDVFWVAMAVTIFSGCSWGHCSRWSWCRRCTPCCTASRHRNEFARDRGRRCGWDRLVANAVCLPFAADAGACRRGAARRPPSASGGLWPGGSTRVRAGKKAVPKGTRSLTAAAPPRRDAPVVCRGLSVRTAGFQRAGAPLFCLTASPEFRSGVRSPLPTDIPPIGTAGCALERGGPEGDPFSNRCRAAPTGRSCRLPRAYRCAPPASSAQARPSSV
jgi:hypothetical protein